VLLVLADDCGEWFIFKPLFQVGVVAIFYLIVSAAWNAFGDLAPARRVLDKEFHY